VLSIQQISDRLEIQQLLVDYANAIDRRDFDALDSVFTADAYIDYRAMGGIDGRYPEIKAWLAKALASFPHYQHLVGNMDIRVDGDAAVSRTACFNPMAVAVPAGKSQVMFLGLWYRDRFVRTPSGWRMCERVEESCYAHNVPGSVEVGHHQHD
jgi:3-phenylpropionate/cinnamic acid dioxygenase small subunit